MIALTFEQLLDGHEKAIITGYRLLMAAMSLVGEFPEVSLGIAELGQEEIGKSLSFLAAFGFDSHKPTWSWFWSAWRNHQLKAHRAYLYELIYPHRIETLDRDGSRLPAPSVRAKIKQEKEYSFYVNFDAASGTFKSPVDAIDLVETANRVLTLLYLASTARSVRLALDEQEKPFGYVAFSEIALRICSENLFQEDMPSLFKEFEARSTKHGKLISSLRNRLEDGRIQIEALLNEKGQGSHPSSRPDYP
jgi:AbiV family abortive infection protein